MLLLVLQGCTICVPYLGLHNAQDFAQILYFAGGVSIINKNNVFHSFFQTGKSHVGHFYFFTLCQSRLSYLYYLDNDILKLKTINICLFYSSLKKIIVLSRRNTLKTIKNIYDWHLIFTFPTTIIFKSPCAL